MSIEDQLLEMGFSSNQINAAVNHSSSLEDCIAFIEEHQEDIEPSGSTEDVQVRDADPVDGPVNAEITESTNSLTENPPPIPLTAEEKENKLALLKQKARLRKIEQAKKDAEEKRKNEAILKKQTKERRQIVEEQEFKQAQRDAAKRRQEALEDKRAKQRVRDLIEADKRQRAEEKARSEGQPMPTVEQPASQPIKQRAQATDSRIRFHVQGKSIDPFVKTYPVITDLGQVADDVASMVDESRNSIQFMTTFPTKTYTKTDFDSSLEQLGLVNTNLVIKLN